MGTDERDRRKPGGWQDDGPDVEAHKAPRANDDGPTEPEDKRDDEPDVEAHVRHSGGR